MCKYMLSIISKILNYFLFMQIIKNILCIYEVEQIKQLHCS